MAKRKRLDVTAGAFPADLETKSMNTPRVHMPIAKVAGEVAGRAALEEVAREMTVAESEGRVVKKIPLQEVVVHHLSRDRIVLEEEPLQALVASIKARGQQTPIEVVRLSEQRFGLISGMRRVEALRLLGRGTVLALVRQPEGSQGAYQAMVEENEVRADLSFYERANIVVGAVAQGVFPDPHAAVKVLFAHAPKARRSKILKFVSLHEAIGDALTFPTAIPEHLGVRLGQAFEADPALAGRLRKALSTVAVTDAAEERRVLEHALKGPVAQKQPREKLAPGLMLEGRDGKVILSGKAVDQDFLKALRAWAAKRT